MDWDQTPPREACFTELFDQQREEIAPDLVRFEEAWRYTEAVALHHPRRGIETETAGIWVAPMQLPIDGERVRASVFYEFDEGKVTFLSIVRNPDEEDGEEELF
jgi:hypothetical protein